MTKANHKAMGLAVASGKVGMVILRDGQLLDWKVSKVAARSLEDMMRVVQGWLKLHRPNNVITEAINPYSRKSDRTLALMSAAEQTIQTAECAQTPRHRQRSYPNKYDEIAALSEAYPAIAPWAPEPRKCYDPEPLNTILFEALALAVQQDT